MAILSPCDLGFGNDYDGCTDNCEVEGNFACQTENTRSICSYNGTLSIKVLNIEKKIFSNELAIEFQLSPDLYLFRSVDPNSFFSFEQTSIK